VTGARLRDHEGERDLEVRARITLNAAGPEMGRVLKMVGIERPPVPLQRAINLVLRRPVVAREAVGARVEGRYLFFVPWADRAIVGTAYAPLEMPQDELAARFLREAQRGFPWAELREADVALVHHGLVPGRSAHALWTRPLLIDHEAEDGVAGLVSMLGVKYTTARGVAEQAVDRVVERLGREAPPCRTATTPLALEPGPEASLEARARRAVGEEMALRLADAVLRRLDLGTGGPPAEADLEVVVRVMAEALGWDPARCVAERAHLAETYR
jgi:glycerol-3-phosphate dehydrogenase